MSQLRNDCEKRIQERMRLWLRDSFALYDMAGLDEHEAYSDVLGELFRQIAAALASTDADPDEVGRLMTNMLRSARNRHLKRRRRASDEHVLRSSLLGRVLLLAGVLQHIANPEAAQQPTCGGSESAAR